MKVIARILSLVMLAGIATFYMSCKGDDPEQKPKEEVQLDKLKGTWALQSATLDGAARTDFVSVVLTVTGNYAGDGATYNYSFTGTFPNPSPWPKTGTFKFGANPETQIIRLDDDPDFGINYSVTTTSLTLTLENYVGSGFAGGRVEEVEGEWVFTFTKQ